MEEPLRAAKAAMRRQLRERLSRLTPAERVAASRELCARLRQRPVWNAARSVLFFAPLPEEVDLWPLIQEALASGRTVTLPRFAAPTKRYGAAVVRELRADLVRGQLGIREPRAECAEFSLSRLDLVLVPGVAFDLQGRRLGRGKGFYDRLLAEVRGVKCGVAFDAQVVAEVPAGPQDALLNCIITPSRWLEW